MKKGITLAEFYKFGYYNWFPGHMYRATNQLKEQMTNYDVFIEIRDARLPYSSMNYELDDMIKLTGKKKIVIFNKYDLCNAGVTQKAIKNLEELGMHGFATSAINKVNLQRIIRIAREIVPPKFHSSIGTWMMIGGMPNIGKSTIINSLRQQAPQIRGKYITKTSKTATETRHITGFKISKNPHAWLIDTPGLMVPSLIEPEVAIKLGLVGCIKDTIIGRDIILEFLLAFWKEYDQQEYLNFYGLKHHPETATDLILILRKKFLEYDYERTAFRILNDFRMGKLGRATLDQVDLK